MKGKQIMNGQTKGDRRVSRTKSLLRNALIELVMEKKLNEITVKELCERADINRGTFYLHYRDVYELFETIEEEIYEEIREFISREREGGILGDTSTMLPTFEDIYEYLDRNREVCIMLLTQNYVQDFMRRILMVGYTECVENWVRRYAVRERETAEMFYHFIVSGCVGVVQNWFQSGRKETPKELARISELFITQGIGMLENYGKQGK